MICASPSLPLVTERITAERSTKSRHLREIFDFYRKMEEAGARSDCSTQEDMSVAFWLQMSNIAMQSFNERNMEVPFSKGLGKSCMITAQRIFTTCTDMFGLLPFKGK